MVEFTREMYHSEKLRQYYGVTLFTTPDRARKHIRMLKGDPYYMTAKRISQLSGIAESNICWISRGNRGPSRNFEPVGEIHRATEAAILGVKPETAPPKGGGGRVEPVGARRRLQALVAVGWPLHVLSDGMGWGPEPQPVHRMINGKSARNFVMHATHLAACALFVKLGDVDPAELGHSAYSISRAQGVARRNRWAPPWCWDEDTIDDPDAIPEWTGNCGTPLGYLTHTYGGIEPVCEACIEAVRLPDGKVPSRGSVAVPYKIDPEVLAEAIRDQGTNAHRVDVALTLSHGTVTKWLSGAYSPRIATGMRLAAHLDLPWTDLYRKVTE
jgi:hypothetical protein